MNFMFYSGKQSVITISNNRLSRIYRFEKGKPTKVDNHSDELIILGYLETNGGTGCGTCSKFKIRPFRSDIEYCRIKRLNLQEMRQKWENELQN